MAKKVYDEDGLDMQKTDWSGDESTGNLPVSGRLVENYIKSIDDKATPTEELAAGETKAPTSGAVFALCLCAVFGLAWLAVHLFQAG